MRLFERAAKRFVSLFRRKPTWKDYTYQYTSISKEEFIAKWREAEKNSVTLPGILVVPMPDDPCEPIEIDWIP